MWHSLGIPLAISRGIAVRPPSEPRKCIQATMRPLWPGRPVLLAATSDVRAIRDRHDVHTPPLRAQRDRCRLCSASETRFQWLYNLLKCYSSCGKYTPFEPNGQISRDPRMVVNGGLNQDEVTFALGLKGIECLFFLWRERAGRVTLSGCRGLSCALIERRT